MSYFAWPPTHGIGGLAFGAAAASAPAAPCGPGSGRSPADGECYCQAGMTFIDLDDESKGCKPIDPNKPCKFTLAQRSPVDRSCTCPPGTEFDPRPEGTACIPMTWFPECKDARGQPVPGCFMGHSTRALIPAAAAGLVAGLVVTGILAAIFR